MVEVAGSSPVSRSYSVAQAGQQVVRVGDPHLSAPVKWRPLRNGGDRRPVVGCVTVIVPALPTGIGLAVGFVPIRSHTRNASRRSAPTDLDLQAPRKGIG